MKAGRDPAVVSTATILRMPAPRPGDWVTRPVPVVLPRLAISRDGKRAKIITPAGAVQWMDITNG